MKKTLVALLTGLSLLSPVVGEAGLRPCMNKTMNHEFERVYSGDKSDYFVICENVYLRGSYKN